MQVEKVSLALSLTHTHTHTQNKHTHKANAHTQPHTHNHTQTRLNLWVDATFCLLRPKGNDYSFIYRVCERQQKLIELKGPFEAKEGLMA